MNATRLFRGIPTETLRVVAHLQTELIKALRRVQELEAGQKQSTGEWQAALDELAKGGKS